MVADFSESPSIKQALIAIKQLQFQLNKLQNRQQEPIAIISMACRFPGGVNNPQQFWELLVQEKDAISEIPSHHWLPEEYYDSDPQKAGKSYSKYGGFVDHLTDFDAQFFNISPKEAISLDPQQRLFLEVSWEAIENAGITMAQLSESKTGVFVASCGHDYLHQLLKRSPEKIDAYLTTGNNHSVTAGRLSYFLNLTGPSLAVNTACSSSLVAVHLAIASLRNQECDLAIVGGVNRIISPEITINFSKARMLSPTGLCQPFDAKADGFVRSEGCGVIVVKRLEEAIAHRDPILAVLYGSAVNQDGRSNGLTAPNGNAQEKVIQQALVNSGKQPREISYIEAHGTGTILGDPIEVNALGRVFSKEVDSSSPILIGSVKANLGHLEAAAGIASLIKVILCIQHQAIPGQINFSHPNPHIDWQQLPFLVPTKLTSWLNSQSERIAGVSSFGFSGTNAHLIIGEGQQTYYQIEPKKQLNCYLFTLSTPTEAARNALIQDYLNFLDNHPDLDLAELCYSTNVGRTDFNYRLGIVTTGLPELKNQLKQLLNGVTDEYTWLGKTKVNYSAAISFVFPTDISFASIKLDWLRKNYLVCQETIAECDRLISALTDSSLVNLPDSSPLVIFTVEYVVAKLWQSWGIIPRTMRGEGVGVWVSKTLAGTTSLSDSLKSVNGLGYKSQSETLIINQTKTSEDDYTLSMDLEYLDIETFLFTKLAEIYLLGIPIDWLAVESYILRPQIPLPNYPFQRRRYWID